MEADRYHYRVSGKVEYADFVATCDEFSEVTGFASTLVDAVAEARRQVTEAIVEYLQLGWAIPEPMTEREDSEPLDVCVPADLHSRLQRHARMTGSSFEEIVNKCLNAQYPHPDRKPAADTCGVTSKCRLALDAEQREELQRLLEKDATDDYPCLRELLNNPAIFDHVEEVGD